MTKQAEEKLIQKAKDLLFPYNNRYYNTLSDVHWVEKDDETCDYDYCSKCIDAALRKERKEYLIEQRMLPIAKRDKEFYKFTPHYNYGGGYESEGFIACELCGEYLDIVILPTVDELEYILEDLRDGKITDCIGWKAYGLLYNNWGEDKGREEERELTLRLAKRVIEILRVKEKTARGKYIKIKYCIGNEKNMEQ